VLIGFQATRSVKRDAPELLIAVLEALNPTMGAVSLGITGKLSALPPGKVPKKGLEISPQA